MSKEKAENLIEQLKAEGCIIDNDAGNRAVEIIMEFAEEEEE